MIASVLTRLNQQMIRLLLIDDNQGDRLLAIRVLQRELQDLQIAQVGTEDDFRRALAEANFDLVITDYRLGWSDGLTVAKVIKSSCPDCPVIMFTDSGNEEVAVAAMKAGLDDYILKSGKQAARLPIAVRTSLQRAQERTERKQAEAALQQSHAQIESLNRLHRLKDDFLSTVSHELRTPVANMKMAIQMLKLTSDEERRNRYLEILQTECDREAALINDLLALQKAENASISDPSSKLVNLETWLPSIIQPFQTRAQQQHQRVEIFISQNLPLITVDQDRLARVLVELLNNACKYTPAERIIQFHVQYLKSSEIIEFKVQNQAEIAAKELTHIFEKFYRVPNSDPWKQGGTGLGLALVEKLVEQMQGKISVKSQAGWTTFLIQIPTNHSATYSKLD